MWVWAALAPTPLSSCRDAPPALLGVVTKAVIELFNGLISVLWTWLPDQLGVEPSSFWYLANSVAALGSGAPLSPEAALVSVVGGTFYWAKRHMEDLALGTYGLLRGRPEDDAARAWRYAPAVVAVVVLVMCSGRCQAG